MNLASAIPAFAASAAMIARVPPPVANDRSLKTSALSESSLEGADGGHERLGRRVADGAHHERRVTGGNPDRLASPDRLGSRVDRSGGTEQDPRRPPVDPALRRCG